MVVKVGFTRINSNKTSLLPLHWIRMSLRDRPAACICSSDFSRLRNPCSKGTQYGVAITILDHDWSFYYPFVSPTQPKIDTISISLKFTANALLNWSVSIKKFASTSTENGPYLNRVKVVNRCVDMFVRW